MTTAYAEQSPGQMATDVLAGAKRGLDGLRQAWNEFRLYHRTLEALRSLPEHGLADMGLVRGDLERAARAAVRGK